MHRSSQLEEQLDPQSLMFINQQHENANHMLLLLQIATKATHPIHKMFGMEPFHKLWSMRHCWGNTIVSLEAFFSLPTIAVRNLSTQTWQHNQVFPPCTQAASKMSTAPSSAIALYTLADWGQPLLHCLAGSLPTSFSLLLQCAALLSGHQHCLMICSTVDVLPVIFQGLAKQSSRSSGSISTFTQPITSMQANQRAF